MNVGVGHYPTKAPAFGENMPVRCVCVCFSGRPKYNEIPQHTISCSPSTVADSILSGSEASGHDMDDIRSFASWSHTCVSHTMVSPSLFENVFCIQSLLRTEAPSSVLAPSLLRMDSVEIWTNKRTHRTIGRLDNVGRLDKLKPQIGQRPF